MLKGTVMDLVADNLHLWLDGADDTELEALPFGVIGLDTAGLVRRYSELEARMAGLEREQVLGRPFFEEVARCMNNSLVAQRYSDASALNEPLDLLLDYVLAFKSQITPVKLRLLSDPGLSMRYLLVQRLQHNAA